MATPKLVIEPLVENFQPPEYMTDGASCMDIYLPKDIRIAGRHECISQVIGLGFKLDIPKGYSARLHMRSSICRDHTLQLANMQGIIDNDFTGEVCAIVRNLTNEAYYFRKGQRLFQLELVKDNQADIVIGEVTKDTERGSASGSTGI